MRRLFAAVLFVLATTSIVVGVLISLTVVTKTEDSEHGATLRCGSAFNRDEEAANQYRLSQVTEALDAAGENIGNPSAGTDSKAPADHEPVGLENACAKDLSTRRAGVIACCVATVLLLIVGILVWRWQPTSGAHAKKAAGLVIEGTRLPKWMRECRDWVSVALTLLAGFTGLFTSIYTDNARLIWFAVTAGLVLLAGLIAIARDDERRRREKWVKDAETSHLEALRVLLGRHLYSLLMLVAEAASTANAGDRKMLAHSARVAILAAAANLVGQKATHGTRANLFRFDENQQVMKLEPGGFAGGERSERIFRPGHETYDATMDRKGVFIGDVRELDGGGAGLTYETFITYPVHVPSQIHGVLTVDCMHRGDLVEEDDVPVMSVLASLIAITYQCEKYARTRI